MATTTSWVEKWKKPKSVTVHPATKAPTGLSIKRSGMNFTFSWKCKDSNYNDGQWLQWSWRPVGAKKWKKWNAISVTTSDRKKVLKLSLNSFYPITSSKMIEIRFRVRGRRGNWTTTEITKDTKKKIKWKQNKVHDPKASKWVTKKYKFEIPKVPNKPTFSLGSQANTGTFEWSTPTSTTDNRPFTRVVWQSIMKKDFTKAPEKAAGFNSGNAYFQTGTGSASGSKTITEDSGVLANKSYTRIFRVQARGPRGYTKWRYAAHVYAMPETPVIDTKKTVSKRDTISGVIHTVVAWTVGNPRNHPIDYMTVEYIVDTPETNLACPSGASATEAVVVKWKDSTMAAEFNSDTDVGDDQCMWVRVTAKHDDNIAYSKAVRTIAGPLKNPSFSNPVTTTGTTVTVEVENKSDVPGAKIAVYLRRDSDKNKDIIIGVIPAGGTGATINCPNLTNVTSYQVGLRAFTGSTKYANVSGEIYRKYTLTPTMQSDIVWNDTSTLPQPPANLTATATAADSVRLNWDWSWSDAEAVQISWADHEDAWESTEEPSTYDIDHMMTNWSVGGLDADATWYFRVRLVDTSGEEDIYSPWSDIASLNLASAPTSPTLAASESILNMSDTIYMTCGSTGTGDFTVSIAEVVVSEGYVPELEEETETTEEESGYIISYTEFEVTEEENGETVTRTKYHKEEILKLDGMPVCVLQAPATSQLAISINDINDIYTERGLTEVTEEVNGETVTQTVNRLEDYLWTADTVHYFAARVANAEGVVSETWSEPITLNIVSEPSITSVTTSLVETTVTEDEDNGVPVTRTINCLQAMPLTVTVVGAGEGGETKVTITRAEDYRIARPTELKEDRFAGEIIAAVSQIGEAQISVTKEELIGAIDDEAKYILTASVTDNYGQTAKQEIEFEANWAHQPAAPEATVEADDDNLAIKITPTLPTGYESENGDVCDIYRLSVDRPVLIVSDAAYGTTYVDPYPAFNEHGGHRIVAKTANEDYITSSGALAWLDLQSESEDIINEDTVVIDFDGQRISLPYNITLSNSWEKDFERTTYLGGSVEGDWNPAVTRDLDLSTDVVLTVAENTKAQQDMRRLADYPGICHIRTPEGSSFAANIDVSEEVDGSKPNFVSYSLSIKKIDPEGEEGMTLTQWNAMQNGGG